MNKINFYLESRLASIKKRAEGYAKHNPEGAYKSALEWQVKYGRKGWRKYDSANEYSEGGDLYLYSLDGFDAVPIQEISRRAFDYSGYYADSFQGELIRPYIVKIKTSRGLFIAPAVDYSDCDIATIYLSQGQLVEKGGDIDAAAYDCARSADRIAERIAEENREADAENQAIQQQEDLKDANKEARAQAHTLIQAIKEQRKIGAIVTPICDALISEIKGLRREIQRNNERISALASNYWLAVE